jgi:mRNA-degrading endonuclease toxin of MazEF toxin-antitoxin module
LQGYKYNRGAAYIPFNILNEQGVETPARYIKVHLEVPNPFAEAQMSMHGPVYCREIHTAPVNDTETPAQKLTTERIHIIDNDYRYCTVVDDVMF